MQCINAKTRKRILTTFYIAVALIALGTVMIVAESGNIKVAIRLAKLKDSIQALGSGSTIDLGDVIPFKWDIAYSFEPSVTIAEIESTLGFKSQVLKGSLGDGALNIVFLYNEKIVCVLNGYPNKLGISIVFEGMIYHSEKNEFNINRHFDYVELVKSDGNIAGNYQLTMQDLKDMVASGKRLSWEDFEEYKYIEYTEPVYCREYKITDTYKLTIGGSSVDKIPIYMRLVNTSKNGEYMDLRTDDIDSFLGS